MDISDNFEQQQQQQQAQETSGQQQFIEHQQQQQLQLMQIEPYAPASNGFINTNSNTTTIGTQTQINDIQMQTQNTAIPLPAPPVKISSNEFMSIDSQQGTAPPALASTDIDIDSLLLQKFSCLGTTDHEDIINQFQCIMNNQINKDSAKFFLEMSNWNLQTAVGCYLDFANLQTLPSMKIVEQSKPNLTQQAWRLQNDGTESWPNGCYLMSPTQQRRIYVPPIKPGETCDILADIPPQQPAVMWRLCTPNGWYYGEPIWMIPQGTCNTMDDLHQRMSQLITNDATNVGQTNTTSTSTNNESFPQINIVISPNME